MPRSSPQRRWGPQVRLRAGRGQLPTVMKAACACEVINYRCWQRLEVLSVRQKFPKEGISFNSGQGKTSMKTVEEIAKEKNIDL